MIVYLILTEQLFAVPSVLSYGLPHKAQSYFLGHIGYFVWLVKGWGQGVSKGGGGLCLSMTDITTKYV